MRYIIIILVAICVFAACSEDKFTTYDSTRYLYFAKGITADSITESFFFYPDETRMIFGWSYYLPVTR